MNAAVLPAISQSTTSLPVVLLALALLIALLALGATRIRRDLLLLRSRVDKQQAVLAQRLDTRAWLASAQLACTGTEQPHEHELLARLRQCLDSRARDVVEPLHRRAAIEWALGRAIARVVGGLRRYQDASMPQYVAALSALAYTDAAIARQTALHDAVVLVYNRRMTRFPQNIVAVALGLRLIETLASEDEELIVEEVAPVAPVAIQSFDARHAPA